MPTYEFRCPECGSVVDLYKSFSSKTVPSCEKCEVKMEQQWSEVHVKICGDTSSRHKEREHRKKVKDPDRAVKNRKKMFGKDSVGDPSMKNDPRHVIKPSHIKRPISGGAVDIDKKELLEHTKHDPALRKKAEQAIARAEALEK